MNAAVKRPFGYFVHHQGRGHAERAAAIANALAGRREVTVFCARPEIMPELGAHVTVTAIPSLFEPTGAEAPRLASAPTPATLHCAPLGWPSIRSAIATLTAWFAKHDPALFITDVSAELGQLARIASVPHVAVLQHGHRSDPGHLASYEAAVGLLAPFAPSLEQPDRPAQLTAKTHYAGGVGVSAEPFADKRQAREALGLPLDTEIVLVVAGGGGQGTPTAPLTLGARAEPDTRWIVIGETSSEWHETPPGNLELRGWVGNPRDYIAAADRVVSSAGNTLVHTLAQAGKPWVVVPEWRYFAEQLEKARALDRAGACAVCEHWPSDSAQWLGAWQQAGACDLRAAASLVDPDAALNAAIWLDELADRIWEGAGMAPMPAIDVGRLPLGDDA